VGAARKQELDQIMLKKCQRKKDLATIFIPNLVMQLPSLCLLAPLVLLTHLCLLLGSEVIRDLYWWSRGELVELGEFWSRGNFGVRGWGRRG